MARNDIIAVDRPVIFVIDKSFLHDYFRHDYPTNKPAKWLFNYFAHRMAHSLTKICVISSTALDRWREEFTATQVYTELTPRAILSVEAWAEVISLQNPSLRLDDSTLIIAKVLYDHRMIPVIISSVKPEKWADRTQKLGIKLGIAQFSEDMSEKRVDENMWSAPLTAEYCVGLMKTYDRLFEVIVKEVGYPET